MKAKFMGSSPALARDTSPEFQDRQFEIWRKMSSVDRARIVGSLSRSVQELALAGIRRNRPEATERECLLRLALLKLGRELTLEAYPDAVDLIPHR